MKKIFPALLKSVMLVLTLYSGALLAQSSTAKQKILIDVAHGQKFWNDPASMQGMDPDFIERVRYMTDEITKSANAAGGDIGYVKGKIGKDDLAKAELLFIHIPSAKYDGAEVGAIRQFIQNGGSLFIVMDADYWSTLAQTNVNDIITPFGITFGKNSPDTLSGGYTKAKPISERSLKIPVHGARLVTGGTPFCFSVQSQEHPFGTFKQVRNGGKMVVMGDGMVSLYMTSWNGVEDYQCREFMKEVFEWLLK